MVCIYCGNETRVINSRPQKRQNQVWRRRKCVKCAGTITTLEKIDYNTSLVVENHGKIEPFSRDKLFLSLYKSLAHRSNAINDAGALTSTITSKILASENHGLININALRRVIEQTLLNFDKPASVHYQAFHGPRT